MIGRQQVEGAYTGRRKYEPVGRMAPGDHLCLLFDTGDEQLTVTRSYVLDGLRAGYKVVHFVDPAVADGVLLRLLGLGGEIASAMDSRQLEIRVTARAHTAVARLDSETLTDEFRREATNARAEGFPMLRMSTEISRLPPFAADPERLATFEQGFRRVVEEQRLTILCQYDRAHFGAETLERYCRLHGNGRVRANDLFDDGSIRISPTFGPAGLEIVGKLARRFDSAAMAVVQSVCKNLDGDVHISVAATEFCGEAGVRALAGIAVDLAAESRQVHFHSAPQELLELLRVYGLD